MKKLLEVGVGRVLRHVLGPGVEAFGADENWPVLFFVPDSAVDGGDDALSGAAVNDGQGCFASA